jgi:hypothetical protein
MQAPVRPLPMPNICGAVGVIFPPEETIMMIVYHTALRLMNDWVMAPCPYFKA